MAEKNYLIRPFAPGDGDALVAIYRQAVAEIARRDYSDAQIGAWLSIAPDRDALEVAYGEGRHAFVAVDGHSNPCGFSDVAPDGHIQFLYVAPAAAARGLGSRLLATVECTARRDRLERIYSEASETALSLFVKSGFRCLKRRDLEIGGVAIHNYAVEKRIKT